MKLGAVVGGDGAEGSGLALNQADSPLGGLCSRSCIELADLHETGFAIDQADDAVLVGVTDDSVDFPMTHAGALLGSEWPFGDVTFAGQPSPTVMMLVALASQFACTAQVLMQLTAMPTDRCGAVALTCCASRQWPLTAALADQGDDNRG